MTYTKEQGKQKIKELVERFRYNLDVYKKSTLFAVLLLYNLCLILVTSCVGFGYLAALFWVIDFDTMKNILPEALNSALLGRRVSR
jgi:hypothetical protein